MTAAPLRILLLGGTAEAMALAQALEGDGRFAPVYSIAGITRAPRLPELPCRRGGFGGVDGLVAYLQGQGVEVVIDATHPFAAAMSRNAAEAARRTGTPLVSLRRPPWTPAPGDAWQSVVSLAEAAAALGAAPRRVFLTTGKTELAPFLAAPQHFYLIRSVERPERLPPQSDLVLARGPFPLAEERALLREYGIDTLVSKNAGGPANGAKLQAARALGVAVVMVERPPLPDGDALVADADAALNWLAAHYRDTRRTDLGV